jgi:hypothetical protein
VVGAAGLSCGARCPLHVKICAAIGAVLIAAALAAAPPSRVDEGLPDRAGHPDVGVLGADPDGDGPQTPYPWCSGSVISDRVFLTAAHCIVAQPPQALDERSVRQADRASHFGARAVGR